MFEGFVPPRFRILEFGDPVLRERAEEVTDFDDHNLLNMVERLHKANELAKGAGVCAPQLGLNIRVYVWKFPRHTGHIVNPTVKEVDDKLETQSEGCLSFPDMYFDIERPKSCYVVGQDMLGNEISFEAESFHARLVQHEIDHLNGSLLIDRLNDEQWKDFQDVYSKRYGKPSPGDRQPVLGD